MFKLITGRIRYQSLSAVDKTLFSQNVIGDLLSFSNLPRVKYEIHSDDIDAGTVLIEAVKDSVDDNEGQGAADHKKDVRIGLSNAILPYAQSNGSLKSLNGWMNQTVPSGWKNL